MLAILACALIPIGVVAFVATQGYTAAALVAEQGAAQMTSAAIQGFSEMSTVAVQGYTQMKEEAIPPSKEALDERSKESFELWAFDTAHRIADFLYEREQDLLVLAGLPRDPQSYLSFYKAHNSTVWTLEEGSDVFADLPLYRELAFIDAAGHEILRIQDGVAVDPTALRDVSLPQFTTYKKETYWAETMPLDEGEVYVSRVLGWYIPLQDAYAAGEKEGKKYEGVIRFATPVFENGEKIGMVMLSLDHTHIMEFTSHMVSTDEHYTSTVSALSGEHSYIIDNECWAIAQPRHFYIAGFDEDGYMVPPIVAERFAEQQESGYLPANLNHFGFIDEAFPRVCELNRQGQESGTVEYNWVDREHPEGRPRALAFATIPYHTGRYNSPAGFGWVAVTADSEKWHEPADLVEDEIERTADRVEGEIEVEAQRVESELQQASAVVESEVTEERRLLINNTALIVGVTMAVVVVIAALLARTITRPIQYLVQGTEAIGRGDLDTRVEIDSRDELGQLAGAFNQMTVDLKRYTVELARTTAERERLVRELEIARDIQRNFLPATWPKIAGVDLAAMNLPARHVGGDFYDFIPLADGRLGLVVADVSDKGVPAALFMALSRSLIRAYSMDSPDVLTALKQANAFISVDNESMMFVTLFYAVLDPHTMRLSYINAGHNPPMLVGRDSSRLVMLEAKGIALGVIEDISLEEHEVQLEAGDVLVLYTDGVTEAMNVNRELFGEQRLQSVVAENLHLSAEALMRTINEKVELFTHGEPQSDDITLMVAKVKADPWGDREESFDGAEQGND
jgi:HAMP domain-containing protein